MVLLLLKVNFNGQAQDLIITQVGDSLNVKVLTKDEDYLHFFYKEANHFTTRQLPLNQIKKVVSGYFQGEPVILNILNDSKADTLPVIVLSEEMENADLDTLQIVAKYQPEFYIGGNGGLSKRLYGTRIGASQLELEYIQKLKSGVTLGLESYYFFKRHWGVGLRYDSYFSKAEMTNFDSEDVKIEYIGAGGVYRKPIFSGNQAIQFGFWMGYQPYSNKRRIQSEPLHLQSKSMGWGLTASIFQPVGKQMLVSLTGSCFLGAGYKMTTKSADGSAVGVLGKDNFEDFTRASLTLGIGYITKVHKRHSK